MHYFGKIFSASGCFVPKPPLGVCPFTLLGDLHPSDPSVAHPWKKFSWLLCLHDCVMKGEWKTVPHYGVLILVWQNMEKTGRLLLAYEPNRLYSVCLAPCGAGAPSPFPLFPLVHLLPHLLLFFTFPFLSLALPIFFFCPSLPFLPE